MKSKISSSGTGGKKDSKNTAPFPLPREEKKKFLDLTERGMSNDIVHGSIFKFLL